MSDIKNVRARMDIEIFVDCPGCDRLIDLLNERDTGGYDHNEEGQIIRQALPDGDWGDAHKNFTVTDVECSICGCSFNVKELEW